MLALWLHPCRNRVAPGETLRRKGLQRGLSLSPALDPVAAHEVGGSWGK